MAQSASHSSSDIDVLLNQFRVASRELFNNYFRISDPYENDGWTLEERFSEVEAVLFDNLVIKPADLPNIPYKTLQSRICAEIRSGTAAPILLNRDLKSGYWDFPIREVTPDARLGFISFFDWDQLFYRDNRYVLVQVVDWAAHPETLGKWALIESHYVRFALATVASASSV